MAQHRVFAETVTADGPQHRQMREHDAGVSTSTALDQRRHSFGETHVSARVDRRARPSAATQHDGSRPCRRGSLQRGSQRDFRSSLKCPSVGVDCWLRHLPFPCQMGISALLERSARVTYSRMRSNELTWETRSESSNLSLSSLSARRLATVMSMSGSSFSRTAC